MVVRNWLIGAHLLEFEQSGQDRATYGERLLSNLAADLKARGLKGLGISMLKNCRQFYRLYPSIRQSPAGELRTVPVGLEIGQSAIGEFDPGLPALPPEQLLRFSWTHFIELIRIDDPLKRALLRSGMSSRKLVHPPAPAPDWIALVRAYWPFD